MRDAVLLNPSLPGLVALDDITSGGEIDGALRAQCPTERPPSFGEVQTRLVGVQPRTSSRHPAARIEGDVTLDEHEPDQIGPACPEPATDAGASETVF